VAIKLARPSVEKPCMWVLASRWMLTRLRSVRGRSALVRIASTGQCVDDYVNMVAGHGATVSREVEDFV
jgi:hypothetical protein